MMQNRTKRRIGVPEILAPAGSMESLKAAVAAGCDAVYMGGSKFGARAYAQNPEEDEMVAAIRYCSSSRGTGSSRGTARR